MHFCVTKPWRRRHLLAKSEIYPEQIHIIVNISGLYSISITQEELVFEESRRSDAAAAEELLSAELPPEIKTKVIVKE